MSNQAPESFTTPGTDYELANSQPSVLDVKAVINPNTDKEEPVTGLQVIEKEPEKVMQVRVEPSGFAHYSLEAVLKNGGRARVFPMQKPTIGPVVGITLLPDSRIS